MTDSFNVYPPASYISDRFNGFDRDNENLLDRIKQLELLVSANAHKQEDGHITLTMLNRANESLTAYIQRVETDLGERIMVIEGRLNQGRVDLRRDITALEKRVSNCELSTTPNIPANEPEPPIGTSWHPYYAEVDGPDGVHPSGDKRVAVMLRNGEINRPDRADVWDWSECKHRTIVAWRNAKEGE